ncbi:MAG: SDR family NAD(P)-dependent oxidoreductase [Gammaproteobacteria bacterium]|jgi:NAD(P)-dependent dehydrogenase (short-subunit alcohol dehydrogenase family)
MAGRVEDKVTIITGAGTGIGAACFELFAREGAVVVGCGRRLEPLQENLAKVEAAGGRGMVVSADLSNAEGADRVVEETIKAYGRVDILVHSASVGWSWSHVSENSMNDIATTPPDKWNEVIGINLNAAYYMSHAVLQHMLKQEKGSIVNVASISGMVGMPTAHTYCSAKGGVINLTRAMAATYAKQGVRANCVCPGYTDTPMIADVMYLFDDQQVADYLTPMARAGQPMEMAYGCLFLASDEASYCNGVVLPIDGGTVARQ